MSLTIVIPTYNEAENLPKLAAAVFAQELPQDTRLLVVDDNSPDGTGELADDLGLEYPGRVEVLHRPEKLGLGAAYVAGYRRALDMGSELIGQMDADFSHPPDRLPDLYARLHEGYDLVIGSRYIPGGSVDERWPLWRKALSRWGSFYGRLILDLPHSDLTGALRMWRREALAKLPLERIITNGYAFQIEVLYLAYKLGLRHAEVPFYFADRKWGVSKMSLSIQLEAALRTWQLRWRYRDL